MYKAENLFALKELYFLRMDPGNAKSFCIVMEIRAGGNQGGMRNN